MKRINDRTDWPIRERRRVHQFANHGWANPSYSYAKAESAYGETFYELQFFAEYLCKSKLGDNQFGSPTSTYLMLRRTGEVVDDHVREQMNIMLKRIESSELVRDWNLEQTAGTPVLNQLKREIAEHPIRDVEALFLERKEKTGW